MEIINGNIVNSIDFIGEITGEEVISSFSNEIFTKYSFKSDIGTIFNFNTIGNSCKGLNQKYGNLIISSNLNDLPDVGVSEYQSPLKNGGFYQNKRFERQVINFELEIISNNINNLEKEIQMMKQAFNSSGRLFKKYNSSFASLRVILKDFNVSELKNSGTSIQVTFESLDPFWIIDGIGVKIFENQFGAINTTIMVNDSDFSPDFSAIFQIGNVFGEINSFILSLDGYKIEVNETINSGSILVFDGKKFEVTLNGKSIIYFGEFSEIPIGKPCDLKVNFGNGVIENYNLYILYDKIIL